MFRAIRTLGTPSHVAKPDEARTQAAAAEDERCRTRLSVHPELGAGLEVSFLEHRGYLVEALKAEQPGLAVGNVIVEVAGRSLALGNEDEADEVLAEELCDGVELLLEDKTQNILREASSDVLHDTPKAEDVPSAGLLSGLFSSAGLGFTAGLLSTLPAKAEEAHVQQDEHEERAHAASHEAEIAIPAVSADETAASKQAEVEEEEEIVLLGQATGCAEPSQAEEGDGNASSWEDSAILTAPVPAPGELSWDAAPVANEAPALVAAHDVREAVDEPVEANSVPLPFNLAAANSSALAESEMPDLRPEVNIQESNLAAAPVLSCSASHQSTTQHAAADEVPSCAEGKSAPILEDLPLEQTARSKDMDATSKVIEVPMPSGLIAKKESANIESQHTAPPELTPAPEGPVSEDVAALLKRCKVKNLQDWLQEVVLEEYLSAAVQWCVEMGAASLEEIAENIEDFGKDIALKPIERQRVKKWAAQLLQRHGSSNASSLEVSRQAEVPSPWSNSTLGRQREALPSHRQQVQDVAATSRTVNQPWPTPGMRANGAPAMVDIASRPASRWNSQEHGYRQAPSEGAASAPSTPIYTARSIRVAIDSQGNTGLDLRWDADWGIRVQSVDPLPGQPGLAAGDFIVAIDGCSLRHRSHEECDAIFIERLQNGAVLSVVRPQARSAASAQGMAQGQQDGDVLSWQMPRQSHSRHATGWSMGRGRRGNDPNRMWNRFRGPPW